MSEKLATYLREENLTQREFAMRVPCREATVSAWMKGALPRASSMKRIEEITGGRVSVTSWFGIAPSEPHLERCGRGEGEAAG